jgi:hypothetical protein
MTFWNKTSKKTREIYSRGCGTHGSRGREEHFVLSMLGNEGNEENVGRGGCQLCL